MDILTTIKELESLQRTLFRIEFSRLDPIVIEAAIKSREATDVLIDLLRTGGELEDE